MAYKHLEVYTVSSLLPLAALSVVKLAKIYRHLVMMEAGLLQKAWE